MEQEALKGLKMLSHCANGACSKPFLRLREGKLFLVETDRIAKPGQSAAPPFLRAKRQQRVVEYFWLCDDCAAEWTLCYDGESRVALVPLRKQIAHLASFSEMNNGAA
jgi:hypothetical protein